MVNKQTDILDIIFQNRNKSYGAYVIRKKYADTVSAAMGVTILALLLLIGIGVAAKYFNKHDGKKDRKVYDANFQMEQPPPLNEEEPPPPPPELPKQVQIERFTPPVIVEDNEVKPDQEVKPPDEIKGQIGTTEQEGIVDPDPVISTAGPTEEDPNKLYNISDVQEIATAPYNLDEYLSNNIEYPDMEKEAGISGDVKVRFIVEKDGSITDVKIQNSVSPGLDEEALRVIKKMKPWKPAKQNGRAVRLSFTKKISFVLE
jgi:protein TonB